VGCFRPFDPMTNQPINRSINQSTNQPTNRAPASMNSSTIVKYSSPFNRGCCFVCIGFVMGDDVTYK
jgi:hypothetical protein